MSFGEGPMAVSRKPPLPAAVTQLNKGHREAGGPACSSPVCVGLSLVLCRLNYFGLYSYNRKMYVRIHSEQDA